MSAARLPGAGLFWMALTAMLPTVILVMPGVLLRLAGPSAWWTPLAAGIPAAGFAWVVGTAAARHGDLLAAARRGLGPVLGCVLLPGSGRAWPSIR